MKIGFSSLVCPDWDIETIAAKAAEYGYDGVELRGVRGELRLTHVPDLAGDPSSAKRVFADKGVELVCLGTSCSMARRPRSEVLRQRAELEEHIELAAKLDCPFVRVFAGEVERGDTREAALSRAAAELLKIAPFASEQRVTILVQNGGDFSGSTDLWFLCDSVSHPSVHACWDPCVAMTVGERPTTSIPRLRSQLGMVHVCDGSFNEMGFMTGGYQVPGKGDVEWGRAIELLRGMFYQDYLVFEWPKLWETSLPGPDEVLPQVAEYLRGRLAEQQPVLTAYKSDKRAPVFKKLPSKAAARPK